MKQGIFKIKANEMIAENVFRMVLCGDTTEITRPGQFINIKLDGLFLRRPISVSDWTRGDEGNATIIYKVVGEGTRMMSKLRCGMELDCLVGLGNGFDTEKSGENPLLIGGGVGVPPLYGLCRELIRQGKKVRVILGFNKQSEVFYEEEFKSIGAEVTVATADGSHGVSGFVTDAMSNVEYSYFYACGPMQMFRAIELIAVSSGQYSFEERMGCGFGACMGCSCKTKYGSKRICKDGPVLEREEVVW